MSFVIFLIMPKAHRSSYTMAFKIKVIAEAEAVENNSEIAQEYGLSESRVRRWRRDQATLLSGELKMSAKRAKMGRWNQSAPEGHLQRRVLSVFPSIRKAEWMSRASENGSDRVYRMLSAPFWCGTHSELI